MSWCFITVRPGESAAGRGGNLPLYYIFVYRFNYSRPDGDEILSHPQRRVLPSTIGALRTGM